MAELSIVADIAALWPLFLAVLVFLSSVFGLAHHRKRYDLIDVFWGPAILVPVLSVVFLRAATGDPISTTQILVTVAVAIWATRLAWHIAKRFARSDAQDPRYTRIIDAMPKRFRAVHVHARIYVVQALLAVLVSTTAIAALTQLAFSVWAAIGLSVWIIGFCIESVADRQLKEFIKIPANRMRVLDTGLWRYSRHPNYFGEVLLWLGVWIVSIGTDYWAVGLVGLSTIILLIIFVSGIPPAESRMKEKLGWQRYRSSTSVFFPLPPNRD